MMIYKQYTLNGSRGVPFGWRCPNCKHLNIGVHRVKASSSYDDRGFRVNLDKRKEKAKEQMDKALEKISLKTILLTENRRFDKVVYTDKCAQCGEVPPWSNLPLTLPKFVTTFRTLCLVAAIALLIIGSFAKTDNQPLMYKLAAGFAVLFGLLLLVGWLKKRKALSEAMPAINALQPENLPHMAMTGPELLSRLNEDGVLTPEEATASGLTPNRSEAGSMYTISKRYESQAEEFKKNQRKKSIVIALVIAAAIGLIGYAQYNSSQTKQWQAGMVAADLFTANPNAGSAFIVQEKRSTGSAEYKKSYLDSSTLASTPEEVGYIIVITDTDEKVGSYGALNKPAYRVHTSVRLFDRHTGKYVGDTISLVGGNPPSSIKSTTAVGRGSRPSSAEITKAINQLMKLVQK